MNFYLSFGIEFGINVLRNAITGGRKNSRRELLYIISQDDEGKYSNDREDEIIQKQGRTNCFWITFSLDTNEKIETEIHAANEVENFPESCRIGILNFSSQKVKL